jgi:hypothetical protein
MPLALPLPPPNHGVVVAPVSLPRELRHPVLVRVHDWRAQAPLSARVVLVADSNPSFIVLSLPRMISCMAYERSSLFLLLWYKSQGIGHQFPHPVFRRRTSGRIPLALSILVTLGSPIWERWLTMMIVESAPMTRAQAVVAGRCRPAE